MPRPTSIEVILNPRSGGHPTSDIATRLIELFRRDGIEARISTAQSVEQVPELARIAADRSEIIVAGGGDGTINSVASVVLARNKVLGVLPLGTMNHLARDLKIPSDLDEAVSTIVRGWTTQIDVGLVNQHIFLNNCSLGLYPSIVTERIKQQRLGHGKWPAVLWAAISVLRRYPFLDVRLKARGAEINSRPPFVFIGNNEYLMEGFNIGVRESLDRGVLSVYMTLRIGRWGLVRLAIRALFGRLRGERDFLSLLTDKAFVETKRKRLRVAFDGEVADMTSPLHFEVREKALTVVVPAREGE